jgi:hypothetical protein
MIMTASVRAEFGGSMRDSIAVEERILPFGHRVCASSGGTRTTQDGIFTLWEGTVLEGVALDDQVARK